MTSWFSIAAFGFAILASFGSVSLAQETDRELERRVRQRYEDFYTHLNESKKQPHETEAAKKAQRREREKYEEQREKSRLVYIRNRQKKKEVSDELHEREIAARKKQLEERRKKYVQQRERREDLLERLPEVPEWVEYRLYDDTLVSDSPTNSSN